MILWKSAETRLYTRFDHSSRSASSQHLQQLKNAVTKPFRSLGRKIRRRSTPPDQTAPSGGLTPKSIGEQQPQPRRSGDTRASPDKEVLTYETHEPATTPTDASLDTQVSETGSAGSTAGSKGFISESLSVQTDLLSDIISSRDTALDPQRDLSGLGSNTTLYQHRDITIEPDRSQTPLRRNPRWRAAVRSRLSEVTTPEEISSGGPELKHRQIPAYSGEDRTVENFNCRLVPQPLTITRNSSSDKPTLAVQGLDDSQEVKREHRIDLEDLPPEPMKLYHPDTWTPSQGEPGDSDPFCPPTCESGHSCEAATLARAPKSEDQQESTETRPVSSSGESEDSQTDCYFDSVSHRDN